MPRKLRFGVAIPTSGSACKLERIEESAKELERLGLDAAFTNDHIHNSPERHALWQSQSVGMGSYKDSEGNSDPDQFESITTFAYLAGKTERIELATGVLPVLLRDPVILAKQIGTLDTLSRGRFIFGVGVSNIVDLEEYRGVGKEFRKYKERYAMLTEYVEAMKLIWTKKSASYHGRYVDFEDLVVYPKPVRTPHPPIWIGTHTLAGEVSRPPVEFALKHADGWIYGFRMRPHHVVAMVEDFNRTAKRVGKNLSDFDWCFQLRLSIADSVQEAMQNCAWMSQDQEVARKHAGYMRTTNYLKDSSGKVQDVPKSALEATTIGKPDAIIKTIEEFVDSGVTYFELFFTYPRYQELVKQMRLFSKEVLPSFG